MPITASPAIPPAAIVAPCSSVARMRCSSARQGGAGIHAACTFE
jgi:hypothetical protein